MVSGQPSTSKQQQNRLVDQVYRCRNLVATYALPRLLLPESTAFIRFRDDLIDRRVLDLGCGAGRLALYLQPLVKQYVGFDISPFMVEHCRAEFADCDFYKGDMRDLSVFQDECFDTVIAISNLFDAVSHEDRLVVLSEAFRVLIPNGLLIFSAHNRNFVKAGQGPQLEWHRNPLTQLRVLADYWEARSHHHRLKLQQRFEPEYALINDSGNNFASLHYYVTRETQLRQLINAGFQPLLCLDSRGRTLTPLASDDHCPSIHYVARRGMSR